MVPLAVGISPIMYLLCTLFYNSQTHGIRAKTIMTFVVIGLIGAGYNFFKFYMSDRDRKIFATIIGLQILANIAQIEVWEGNLGSQAWTTWVC